MTKDLKIRFSKRALLTGCSFSFGVLLPILLLPILFQQGCSLTVTRPVQEMSDTAAALRAAKEVSADTLAPDLFRGASEAYIKGRNEYRMKNFVVAKDHLAKAKRLAEQAELEALVNGAKRQSAVNLEDAPTVAPAPYDYPTPRGTPAQLLQDSGSTGQQPAGSGGGGGTNPQAPPME